MISGSERHTCWIIIEKQIAKRDGIVTKYPSHRVDSWARAELSYHFILIQIHRLKGETEERTEARKEDFTSSPVSKLKLIDAASLHAEWRNFFSKRITSVPISVFHSGNIVMPRFFSCLGDTSPWSDPTMGAQHLHVRYDIMLFDQQMIKSFVSIVALDFVINGRDILHFHQFAEHYLTKWWIAERQSKTTTRSSTVSNDRPGA